MNYYVDQEILNAFESVTNFVNQVNKLPYYGGDKLEQVVEHLFNENNIQDGNDIFHKHFEKPIARTKGEGAKLRTWVRNELRAGNFKSLPDTIPQFRTGLWYINQPMGNGVAYPDHIVMLYGRVVYVEDKSAQKRAAYRYNNTLPHPKTFYILSDKTHNKTAFIQATRMDIDIDEYGFISGWLDDMKLMLSKLEQEKIKEFENTRGRTPNHRPFMRQQIEHTGSVEQRDFIKKLEENEWYNEPLYEMLRQLKKGVTQYLNHK